MPIPVHEFAPISAKKACFDDTLPLAWTGIASRLGCTHAEYWLRKNRPAKNLVILASKKQAGKKSRHTGLEKTGRLSAGKSPPTRPNQPQVLLIAGNALSLSEIKGNVCVMQ
ncbi:MAG: hypothetical protein J6X99_06280 [Bacteroidales bacterium]|nr:hypothetical protein [Bacteroidales bacterium]